MRPARLLVLVAATLLASAPGPGVGRALAADEDPSVEQARASFRDGVALMAAKNYAAALVKFKAVAQVKMTAQVAFNIAECEEHLGLLVSALGNYRVALAKSEDGAAAKVAEEAPARITTLEGRIAKLTLTRREDKPNPDAIIELDGAQVTASQLGVAVPVDPGARTIRVKVGGLPVKTEKVTLGEGEAKTYEVVIPPPADNPGTAPGGPAVAPESGPSVPGIVLTVVGGTTLILGGVFLGLRQGALGELEDLCGGDSSCPATAEETYDQGRLYTGLAEVAIPVGVVAGVVGIVLLATSGGGSDAPADSAEEPTVALGAPGADGPGLSAVVRF